MGPRDAELTITWRDAWDGAERLVPIPSRMGSVRVLSEIGRGGMGVVFRGHDEALERPVAVKFLLRARSNQGDPHFRQFLAGARAEAALRHPNIVAIHTTGVINEVPYLIMEYVDGPTLAEMLRAGGPMSPAAAVIVMSDVIAGVAALHKQGFLHRDLKPNNVLFDRDAHIYVTDFGLAARYGKQPGPLSIAGTPLYMAPEAFRGEASLQTDVYALGAMLYELLAGHPPFAGDLTALAAKHAREPVPMSELPLGLSPAIGDVIERATHKKEIYRYKTADHLRSALLNAAAEVASVRYGKIEVSTRVTRALGRSDSDTSQLTRATVEVSYGERLAQLAAEKRAAAEDAVRGVGVREDGDAEQFMVGHIRVDVPCTACSYNLRALHPVGDCPECGAPIAASLRPDRLMFADSNWLSRLRTGPSLIYAAIPASCLCLLCLAVMEATGRLAPWGVDAAELAVVGCAVTCLAGVLVSTIREPVPVEARRSRVLRWASRVTAVIAFACLVMLYESLHRDLPSVVRSASGVGLLVTLPVAIVTLLTYLMILSNRIPDARTSRQIRIAAIATGVWPIVYVAWFPVTYLSPAAGAAWSVFFVMLVLLGLAICGLIWIVSGAWRRAVRRTLRIAAPREQVVLHR